MSARPDLNARRFMVKRDPNTASAEAWFLEDRPHSFDPPDEENWCSERRVMWEDQSSAVIHKFGLHDDFTFWRLGELTIHLDRHVVDEIARVFDVEGGTPQFDGPDGTFMEALYLVLDLESILKRAPNDQLYSPEVWALWLEGVAKDIRDTAAQRAAFEE